MGLELYLDLLSQPCHAVYIFAKKNGNPFGLPITVQLIVAFAQVNPLRKVPAACTKRLTTGIPRTCRPAPARMSTCHGSTRLCRVAVAGPCGRRRAMEGRDTSQDAQGMVLSVYKILFRPETKSWNTRDCLIHSTCFIEGKPRTRAKE
uniref:Uncharacterized protein n=1 Tax=Theropithecus gelada TaxID=9565 RepID=A0A8D2GAP9_THEGE